MALPTGTCHGWHPGRGGTPREGELRSARPGQVLGHADSLFTERTSLEKTRVSKIHRVRMTNAFRGFAQWCRSEGVLLQAAPPPYQILEDLLARYVQHMKDGAEPFWIAKHAVLGAQFVYRNCRGHIRRAWDNIASWEAERPLGGRVPLPRLCLLALFTECMYLGLRFPSLRYELITLAVLSRVAFEGLLRPGEATYLCPRDVLLPRSWETGAPMTLAIKDPKNKSALGRSQFRIVRCPSCISWMRWLLEGVPAYFPIWTLSSERFRKTFGWVLSRLGVPPGTYSPGSLRAGGATWKYTSGEPVPSLKFSGGWASEKALACYIQEAMAQAIWRSLPDEAAARLHSVAARSPEIWMQPPPLPWSQLFSRPTTRSTRGTRSRP